MAKLVITLGGAGRVELPPHQQLQSQISQCVSGQLFKAGELEDA